MLDEVVFISFVTVVRLYGPQCIEEEHTIFTNVSHMQNVQDLETSFAPIKSFRCLLLLYVWLFSYSGLAGVRLVLRHNENGNLCKWHARASIIYSLILIVSNFSVFICVHALVGKQYLVHIWIVTEIIKGKHFSHMQSHIRREWFDMLDACRLLNWAPEKPENTHSHTLKPYPFHSEKNNHKKTFLKMQSIFDKCNLAKWFVLRR